MNDNPLCVCGHPKGLHAGEGHKAECWMGGGGYECRCQEFLEDTRIMTTK